MRAVLSITCISDDLTKLKQYLLEFSSRILCLNLSKVPLKQLVTDIETSKDFANAINIGLVRRNYK